MHTLDNTKQNRMPKEVMSALGMDFPCATGVNLPVGTLVKLGSTGLVTAVATGAVGEMGIGVVTVSNIRDTGVVTVSLLGVAQVKGVASATIVAGDKLKVSGFTAGSTTFAPATTGYAYGIALAAAANTAEVNVLVFYSPVYIA